MEAMDCDNNIGLGEGAAAQLVRDVMRWRPKTLPSDAKVSDLRRLFANPHVLNALLVDGPAFVGVVDRGDLDHMSDDAPARALARSAGVTIGPEATVTEAMTRLDGSGSSRLVVVGEDGVTLHGLLCLNSGRTGFCR
jgi:CBS domain-containing protein